MVQNNLGWLTVSPLSGSGNGVITVSASTYGGLMDRIAQITATNNTYSLTDTTSVIQSGSSSAYSTQYLTFDIITSGTIEWFLSSVTGGTPPTPRTISYSKDSGETWSTITAASSSQTPAVISVNAGDKILFRGDNASYKYNHFRSYVQFSVYGNIMSLIKSSGFDSLTSVNSEAFWSLFSGCYGLMFAHHLVLPATTLGQSCYWSMFGGCISLITVPSLPATSLAQNCYSYMFEGCKSLASLSSNYLPITNLAPSCYSNMFAGCTSLTTTPKLPATTLSSSCYYGMFQGCSGLTSAPELSATTLESFCYYRMFKGCTSLNYIKCLATNKSADYCTTEWVSGVAASGTFVKNSSASWSSGDSGIPSGWDIQNA